MFVCMCVCDYVCICEYVIVFGYFFEYVFV